MKPAQVHMEGTLLAGKFRVVRLLGTGGMGAVYEVENERLAKRYALKVLHTDEHTSPELVKRFRREIKADGHIRNAHVVEVHDDGVLDTGEPYVIMELLDGETLASLIERKGQLHLTEICDLLGQACDGVQAAHDAGIIHRDLKPANLFITTRDGKPFVKLLDFGVAKFERSAPEDMTSTKKGTLLGTPYYLSPEQIRGNDIDNRVDIYALGVILYECATGRVPYRADTLPLLGVLICEGKPEPLGASRPDLPEEFRNCVVQAIAVERERRTPSARELGTALRAIGTRTHAASTSLNSDSESNSMSTNSDSDPMRSTEIIEEPLHLPPPAPMNEPKPIPALVPQRRFLWAIIATLALAATMSATALRSGMGEGPTLSPSNRRISSPSTSVPDALVEISTSTAAPSASITEMEKSPRAEKPKPVSSAPTSASASATSTTTPRMGTDRATNAGKIGIIEKLPP